jgi:lipoprotein NlpI
MSQKKNKGPQRKKKRSSTSPPQTKPPKDKQPSVAARTVSKLVPYLGGVPLRHKLALVALTALILVAALIIKTFVLPQHGALSIAYPFDGSVFPPEIVPPTIWWEDEESDANRWHVSVEFEGQHDPINVDVDTTAWAPDSALWESIKAQTVNTDARVTVTSLVSLAGMSKTLSSQTISISTSPDSVGAPIFFREVPLPFIFAMANLPMVKWRLGNIGSAAPPPVILSDLPVCANCHSFSADGKTLVMDVDVARDKGAYVHTPFETETLFTEDKIFSWNDYYPAGGSVRTFGFVARVSPDGRHVVGGMKDRVVFLPRPDIEYSQIFFPVSGSIAYFDNETKTINMLPGADNDRYVQTNAVWTSDGQDITFARSIAPPLTTTAPGHTATLSLDEAAEVLGGREYVDESREGYTKFLFDLYRMPFNNGRGGEPIPVEGASGNGKSNYFPKYSPDGKWLVFNQAESFMLLMPSSRLYIMPAEGGEPRLMNCNRESMNSWHSWSPNGKWLVFSSKLFSPYTQLFLTHIDENGTDTPPVMLQNFRTPERAANIPEFVNIDPESERHLEERFVDDRIFFRHGTRLEGYGRPEEAQEQYLESLRLNPDNTEARLALALTYALKNQYDLAKETIGEVAESDRMYSRAQYMLGGILVGQGKFAEAVEEYRLSLSVGNTDPYFDFEGDVYFNLGIALNYLEGYDDATEAFQSALRVDPTRHEAFVHLGNIKLREDDVDGAIRDFESALALDPSQISLRTRIDQLRQGGHR